MPIFERAAENKRCKGGKSNIGVTSAALCADACASRATYFSFGDCETTATSNNKPMCKCICEVKVRSHKCIEEYDANGYTLYEILENPGSEMFEGDIIETARLKQQIGMMEAQESAGISGFDAISRGAWPGGVVYYEYARSFSSSGRRVVQQAINEYQRKTCIRIRPRTNQRNYIQFFHGSGCYSMIGMQGGRQQVSLASPGCLQIGVAIHEIMHALGFFHEQSRLDRDTYIRINWANINTRMYYNFKKYRQGQASTLGEPYDKQSVMHYGNYAFSINRQKTIVSLSNPNERLGQRVGLSTIDVRQLNKYYKCSGGTKPVVTEAPTTTSKDMYPFCKVLKSYCTNSWVKTNCKGTCNVSTGPKCVNKNQYCSSWSASGSDYCTSGSYVEYMKGNCQKACKSRCGSSSSGACRYFKDLNCRV